jgi:hypothetical protein
MKRTQVYEIKKFFEEEKTPPWIIGRIMGGGRSGLRIS